MERSLYVWTTECSSVFVLASIKQCLYRIQRNGIRVRKATVKDWKVSCKS